METQNNCSGVPSPGPYNQPDGHYDVDAACAWLDANAASRSLSACARYVRTGIDRGFGTTEKNSYTAQKGRPNWAWRYIEFLPKIGFKFVGLVGRDGNFTSSPNDHYTPVKGDIAVYQKNGNPNKPGHICMWTGSRWLSDFRQNNMIVYQYTNQVHIFRAPT